MQFYLAKIYICKKYVSQTYPLKRILPLIFGSTQEQLRLICSELLFMLSCILTF
jgi:hypothetical protein